MTNSGIVRAPFTPEQVERLNKWQQCGVVHPFTCGNPDCRSDLVATPDGWKCPNCNYIQDWAHAFMANGGSWEQWADEWNDLMRRSHEKFSSDDIPPSDQTPDQQ